jgi:hypothetical protein
MICLTEQMYNLYYFFFHNPFILEVSLHIGHLITNQVTLVTNKEKILVI